MRDFRQKWDCDALFVADVALYSEENLQALLNLRWLSRVPAKVKACQEVMAHPYYKKAVSLLISSKQRDKFLTNIGRV